MNLKQIDFTAKKLWSVDFLNSSKSKRGCREWRTGNTRMFQCADIRR